MAYSVSISPVAESHIAEAVRWYKKIQPSLASDFILKIGEAIASIADTPKHFQQVYKHYRKVNLNRFPYKLIYKVEKDEIIVIAVIHHKRKSRYWMHRK